MRFQLHHFVRMAKNQQSSKLRILCLHGYRQNAAVFKERTGSFRKMLKKFAEFEFITAPHVSHALEEGEGETEVNADMRGWWYSREDDYFNAREESTCDKGFQASVDLVQETIKTKGPFDGLMGFSQGAAMLGLICGLREQEPEKWPFHFAILIAAFKSKSQPHDKLYEKPFRLPSLHVFGDTDRVIPKEMSETLLPFFIDPKVISHPGGHYVVSSPTEKPIYHEFMTQMLEQKKTRDLETQ